jgi:hypothetical protein
VSLSLKLKDGKMENPKRKKNTEKKNEKIEI